MKAYFTKFGVSQEDINDHAVKEVDNVQSIDVFAGELNIRIRTTGILVMKNGKEILDKKLDLTKEK